MSHFILIVVIMNMKEQIQQLIRTDSLPLNQWGYDIITKNVNFHVHPSDYFDAWKSIDWLSQRDN